MKHVAIIQARMNSTRLPGKIFMPLAEKPLLEHVIKRIQAVKSIDELCVATTTTIHDDCVSTWCAKRNISCVRGAEDDVLSRYVLAAEKTQADVVIRVTADDPFKDPTVIEKVLQMRNTLKLDFAYNNKPATFPEGLDVEIFLTSALKIAHEASTDPFEREHVTQYLYRHPELFSQNNLAYHTNLAHHRWTLDTLQDYDLIAKIYSSLYTHNPLFLMNDILAVLEVHKDWCTINHSVKRSAMYTN